LTIAEFRFENEDRAYCPFPFTVAPPRRLYQPIKPGFRTIYNGKIQIDTGFNQTCGNNAAKFALF